MHDPADLAARMLGAPLDKLDAHSRRVASHFAARRHIARNLADDAGTVADFGQRAADRVAAFGGSWTFVGLFTAAVLVWIAVNVALLARQGTAFDPYPFILLNLFLSMLAAIQAPVILMSQNRQSQKDRLSAAHDYEVNLKAELEIMLLHDKIDHLRQSQWTELLALQRQQLGLLGALAAAFAAAPATDPTPGCIPPD
jgi:uncharacterized membrane protein